MRFFNDQCINNLPTRRFMLSSVILQPPDQNTSTEESPNLPLPLSQNLVSLQSIANSVTRKATWLNAAEHFLISRKSSLPILLKPFLLVQSRPPLILPGIRTLEPPLI